MSDPRVSVLLPSRGRPASLRETVEGLYDLALDPAAVEVLVAHDLDDNATGVMAARMRCRVLPMPRYGYRELHRYVNQLAAAARGTHLFLWNDDARMVTHDWDERLAEHGSHVCVLNPDSNHGNQAQGVAIFPAVHRQIVEGMGHFSRHRANDTYVESVAVRLGILHPIAVYVHHDRADLTGGHDDDTYRDRENSPETFYAADMQALLDGDAERVRAALAVAV